MGCAMHDQGGDPSTARYVGSCPTWARTTVLCLGSARQAWPTWPPLEKNIYFAMACRVLQLLIFSNIDNGNR